MLVALADQSEIGEAGGQSLPNSPIVISQNRSAQDRPGSCRALRQRSNQTGNLLRRSRPDFDGPRCRVRCRTRDVLGAIPSTRRSDCRLGAGVHHRVIYRYRCAGSGLSPVLTFGNLS